MNSIDWTQVSIGVACVGMLGLVLIKVLPAVLGKKDAEQNALAQVVENNTRVVEQLTNTLSVSFARQEAKLDEVVAYVRRCSS